MSNRRLHTHYSMPKETFIGGPWDGRKVPIEAGREDVVAHVEDERPVSIISDGENPSHPAEVRTVRYKRMLFAGEHETHSIFVEASLSSDEVMRQLIARYSRD